MDIKRTADTAAACYPHPPRPAPLAAHRSCMLVWGQLRGGGWAFCRFGTSEFTKYPNSYSKLALQQPIVSKLTNPHSKGETSKHAGTVVSMLALARGIGADTHGEKAAACTRICAVKCKLPDCASAIGVHLLLVEQQPPFLPNGPAAKVPRRPC